MIKRQKSSKFYLTELGDKFENKNAVVNDTSKANATITGNDYKYKFGDQFWLEEYLETEKEALEKRKALKERAKRKGTKKKYKHKKSKKKSTHKIVVENPIFSVKIIKSKS